MSFFRRLMFQVSDKRLRWSRRSCRAKGGFFMEDGRKNMERLTYFLMGSAVAAGLAFLVSPKSGRETREILASKAKEGKDFLGSQLRRGREYMMKGKEQVSEQAKDMASRAKETAREQVEKIQSTEKEGPETISPL
ncbi:MAG: hypothetical protein CVU57_03760 [Deltaproteobacteria bacterium HGW-Deltaproteobacteria-15]|nr:MAG: hypothetical protein CVU57_03760 [Deltaproteobacteria bacterium HGW-Deltaproteobacteria-15]